MKKIILVSIARALLLSSLYLFSSAYAQSDDFNYSTAVSLILQEDSGGHIFRRPDYESPRNFFILIYEIVGKYAIQMQPQHDGLSLDLSSLPIEEKILVINHQSQKLLFLGDHWIGDGERFAIMDSRDYNVLKGYFAQTRKHRGQPTKQSGLAKYIGKIHRLWSDTPDEFYREFYFPNHNTNPNTAPAPSNRSLTTPIPDPIASIPNPVTTNPDNKIEKRNSDDKGTTIDQSHQKAAKQTQESATINNAENSSANLDALIPKKTQDAQIQGKKIESADQKLWLGFLVLIGLSLTVYWWRKKQ